MLHHNLFTSGILYLDMAFDLHAMPVDLVPYLPLFTQVGGLFVGPFLLRSCPHPYLPDASAHMAYGTIPTLFR